MNRSYFLSVVIPAYNEARNVAAVVEQLQQVIARCPDIREYEVLFVDDHSSDSTFQTVRSLENPKVHCMRLSRRSGSHTALRAGLSVAKGDLTLCVAADGQDDPSILTEMIERLKNGYDVVWGVRRRREEPLFSKWVTALAYKIIKLCSGTESSGIDLARADFFILSRKVIDAIRACPERNTSFWGLLLWLGFKQGSVEYDRKSRLQGDSKWSARRKARLFLDWIIAFSGVPLKLITFMGLMTAGLGFLYALFIIFYKLLGYAQPGWAETVVLILVLGGAQMMMLGVLGEYLWRTLDETRSRPLFFIEDQTGPPVGSDERSPAQDEVGADERRR